MSDESRSLVTDLVTDPLTGCRAHGELPCDLWMALTEAARTSSRFRQTFICVDIDNFSRFIDYNGFGLGDEVLVNLGRRLMNSYTTSKVYRYGGEEFVVAGSDQWDRTIAAGLPVSVKHTILNVDLTVEARRPKRSRSWLMLHIHAAIVQSSVRGERLECRNRTKRLFPSLNASGTFLGSFFNWTAPLLMVCMALRSCCTIV